MAHQHILGPYNAVEDVIKECRSDQGY